jgi:hypothetical protein
MELVRQRILSLPAGQQLPLQQRVLQQWPEQQTPEPQASFGSVPSCALTGTQVLFSQPLTRQVPGGGQVTGLLLQHPEQTPLQQMPFCPLDIRH